MVTLAYLHEKNEPKLQGLKAEIALLAGMLVDHCYQNYSIPVRITQGLRTNAEQADLYAQGRTAPGEIVTNAGPGESFHNYGLAFDICLIDLDGNVSWDETADYNGDGQADWKTVAEVAGRLGFEWGDRGYVDTPHFQIRYGTTPQQLSDGYDIPLSLRIAKLGQAWQYGSDTEKQALHLLANTFRKQAGLPIQN